MSPLPKKDLNLHGYRFNDAILLYYRKIITLSFIECKNHDAVHCIVSCDCDEEHGDPMFISKIIH